mmetsp:Transcript_83270/g.201897  ORF Transcript_83270/g.201897 Transcript_83270/m.201897 type:complete len:97 (-) Transcript_83270:839-1129(-)
MKLKLHQGKPAVQYSERTSSCQGYKEAFARSSDLAEQQTLMGQRKSWRGGASSKALRGGETLVGTVRAVGGVMAQGPSLETELEALGGHTLQVLPS